MTRRYLTFMLTSAAVVFLACTAGAGELFAQHAGGHASASAESSTLVLIFGFLELPFLILCVYFAFRTAAALRGGIFGEGMMLLAWGFLIMSIGHAHMQVDHILHFNLFDYILGPAGGSVLWVAALMLTWGLSGIGFYKIYSVSQGAVTA